MKERVQDFWRMRREAIMAKGAGGKGRKKKNRKVKKSLCDIAINLFDVVDENNVPDEEKGVPVSPEVTGKGGRSKTEKDVDKMSKEVEMEYSDSEEGTD